MIENPYDPVLKRLVEQLRGAKKDIRPELTSELKELLALLASHFKGVLRGHIKASLEYTGVEDDIPIIIEDIWRYITYLLTAKKPEKIESSSYIWIKKQADEIIRRHKYRQIALQAAKGDIQTGELLKDQLRPALRRFFYNRNIQAAMDLEDLESLTWNEVFKKMLSPKKSEAYDPPKGPFKNWLLIWADYKARDFHRSATQKYNAESNESSVGSDEKPFQIDNFQTDEKISFGLFSRVKSPEDQILINDCYTLLMKTTFTSKAKPHMLVTFLFGNLLEWKADEIFKELSPKSLWDSSIEGCQEFMDFFFNIAGCIPTDMVNDSFVPFLQKLKRHFEKIYTEKHYEELRKIWKGKPVGSTTLEIFHENKISRVSVWNSRLLKKVQKRLETELGPRIAPLLFEL